MPVPMTIQFNSDGTVDLPAEVAGELHRVRIQPFTIYLLLQLLLQHQMDIEALMRNNPSAIAAAEMAGALIIRAASSQIIA